jgi:regulator of protease activity HflC (stomatin/prohibitin superfamily)
VAATIAPQAELNGLLVQYVAIEDSVIDKAYIQAVRDERISERAIRTAQNNALAAEHKADEAINLAEGQAGAINLLAQAREDERLRIGLTPTEYVWWTTWNGSLPTTLIGDTGEFIVNLP